MEAVDFEGTNITLGKPDDMTDEQCNSIKAQKGVDSQGFPFFAVAFKPDAEDLKNLNEGRPIFLKVIGQGFPPVAVYTLNENGQ